MFNAVRVFKFRATLYFQVEPQYVILAAHGGTTRRLFIRLKFLVWPLDKWMQIKE